MRAVKGRIELILGPMFSGKSTELLRRIRRHTFAKKRCVLLRHSIDMRFALNKTFTHDAQQVDALRCASIADVKHTLEQHQVVGIDEGQFFPDVLQPFHSSADRRKRSRIR